ncbi:MAG: gamma-glutamylcyclotransferase family protein [Cyanobacteria bacterium J06621_11]
MAEGRNVITVMTTLSVFVYGTLKPGGRYHSQYCGQYSPEILPAATRGRLYDFPNLGYPAMTAGDDWVKGYLFRFSQPESVCKTILQNLDALEGYREDAKEDRREDESEELSGTDGGDPNEYERLLLNVFDINTFGSDIGCDEYSFLQTAWVYRMSLSFVEACGGVLVPSGDWPVG